MSQQHLDIAIAAAKALERLFSYFRTALQIET